MVIPYYPLSDDKIRAITRLQLGCIKKQVAESHKVLLTYDDEVIKLIAGRCTELESGGRMIDTILTNTLLPSISAEFLTSMMEGKHIERVHVVSVADGMFVYDF